MTWIKGAALLAAAALLFAGGAAAAPATPVAEAQGAAAATQTITVLGSDQQQVTPDQAQVTLGVQTTASTATAAQSQNSQASQALLTAIEGTGVPAADIRTSWYNLGANYTSGSSGHAPQISGFQATQDLTVTVPQISQVGAVVDAAVAAGANQIQGVSYSVADPGAVELQGYDAAIKNARAQADAIAQALGVQISGVEAADATYSSSGGPRPLELAGAVAAPAVRTPLEPGQQTITTQVRVVYSIS